ncbi:hypothetical protein F2Q70_00037932 [Brassica cretica]|uniref:Uncharacterized protein n=1 Tax=Brassica cretica TaxID=69181 RepID=A0A8S9K6B3_BRACR|nr:hypothetical protein F2Q70_00037932 [Brassica cretica]
MLFTNQVIFSSREFRPPEKLEMANLLSDEPTVNSIMTKVIIHVLNVQESIGLDGFQKDSKTNLFGPNGETDKYWLREKMDFDQASKGHVLAHIRSIFFTFQSPGRGYMKRTLLSFLVRLSPSFDPSFVGPKFFPSIVVDAEAEDDSVAYLGRIKVKATLQHLSLAAAVRKTSFTRYSYPLVHRDGCERVWMILDLPQIPLVSKDDKSSRPELLYIRSCVIFPSEIHEYHSRVIWLEMGIYYLDQLDECFHPHGLAIWSNRWFLDSLMRVPQSL